MSIPRTLLLPTLIGAAAIACFAQPNRIQSKIDATRTVTLPGRVHPLASSANDAGLADSTLPLSLTLQLKPSADQQSGLDQLLQQQQNPAAKSFHQWLTPEQYADRFGASATDIAQITTWLQAQGFTVSSPSRSRTFVTFSGTAGQVQNAFGTAIHRYNVNGVLHYANATDPKIPAALSGMVASIRGLHDFHPHPNLKKPVQPQAILQGEHVLVPNDFATIYDINPMYNAGINGSGQGIMVVGQSALYNKGSDITKFWNSFGITATLVLELSGQPPAVLISTGDAEESDLDIEWAGAVARNATIYFVYSTDVWTSAQNAVDQDFAPVLSMSYGSCEMYDLFDLPGERQTVQQANAEGITWLAAAGDQGAADCDYNPNIPVAVAEGGLAVDVPGVIPEVTAMGGTMFNDNAASWNGAGAATGYIPEVAWNETIVTGQLLAGGGGTSVYFPQPSWQTVNGVPNDGWRHVPDISFNAAAYHDPYYVNWQGFASPVGGTSAATPTMAGVVALLNQYLVQNKVQSQAGLGNINPILYQLSQSAPTAFRDVTSGNNIVPCAYGSPQCNNGSQGFSASPGYDSTTGLGSVDVTNLIQQWSSGVPSRPLVVASINQNPVYQTTGGQWTFQLTLTEEAGFAATLTDFTINGVSQASLISSVFGGSAISARGSISGSYTLTLSTVPANETFGFSGNGWSTALTVPFTGPQTQITVVGASNAATGQQVFAPGMIMAVYGTGLGTLAQLASTLPLPLYMAGTEATINGVSTPLYYVGPNQVNLQIPYETPVGQADLSIGNPYQNVDFRFTVTNVGPGIFTFSDGSVNPSRTAKVGDTVPLFITGEGKVSPSLQDGTSPAAGTPVAQLPKPRATVSVSVGGIAASSTSPYWFVGIPSGLVGVTQINFTIPAGVPSGRQPVIVTVGNTQTPVGAYITIQ